MHPLIARYLSIDAAVDTLRRDRLGEVLKAEERFYAAASRQAQLEAELLLASRGQSHASAELQRALLLLASQAAVLAVTEDPVLSPALGRAREALLAEGATDEQASELVGSILLEEAFGYDAPPEEFDLELVRETLETVPALARLSSGKVRELQESFASSAPDRWSAAYSAAAGALVESAWADGPEPINPEHLEQAYQEVRDRLAPADLQRAGEALTRFVTMLAEAGLVGPIRRKRLDAALLALTAAEASSPRGLRH